MNVATRYLCLLACVLLPVAVFAAPPATPQVERITDRLFRIGKVMVDTKARTVTCTGAINMDRGSIEYLAVAPGGKLHESLLRLDVRPLHLQVALLLLGLEPKNVLKGQGDRTTPQGAPVDIHVRWHDATGALHDAAAETLIAEMSASKPAGHFVSRPMGANHWVFTGSRILTEGFEADIARSLVAVWHDPAALLDNPLPGGADNAYVVDTKRTPKPGTPVEVVFQAVAGGAQGEKEPAKAKP